MYNPFTLVLSFIAIRSMKKRQFWMLLGRMSESGLPQVQQGRYMLEGPEQPSIITSRLNMKGGNLFYELR